MKIIISGTVGVGKSTISNLLYDHLSINSPKGYFIVNELKEMSPYLSYYYDDISSWSFLTQIDFLFKRFNDLVFADKRIDSSKKIIFDRHFLDDIIFFNMSYIKDPMTVEQRDTYMDLNNILINSFVKEDKPDFYVLLKAPIDVVLKRINKRGIDSEKQVNIDYWKELYNLYYNDEKIKKYISSNCKNVILIDANKKPDEIIKEIILRTNI